MLNLHFHGVQIDLNSLRQTRLKIYSPAAGDFRILRGMKSMTVTGAVSARGTASKSPWNSAR